MKSRFNIIIIAFLFISINNYSQNFTGGFNFNLPAQDTSSSKFLPKFYSAPINNENFVGINNDGNFSVNGNAIRFWGTNLVAAGAFPEKTKAWFIAGRLRKMGFNLVRFHHMDNPWSNESLFEYGSDTRHLNQVSLDKFENIISELKKNGVYADVNLHVSRTFKEADGVANADSIIDFGKGVTIFDPYLIFLQKEYARQLLTHLNPYTGLALVDDPVMAMVEITNENSLYGIWRENNLKSFSLGGSLIIRHVRMLDSLFVDYLVNKYSTTENLAAAWNVGTIGPGSVNKIINGDFETLPITTNWVIELHETASATIGADNVNPYNGSYSAKVSVEQITGADWHIQFKQINLSVQKDSGYTVEFAARSDGNKNISVVLMKNSDPYTGYSYQTYDLTNEWQTFSFSFRAPETTNQMRISFQFNNFLGDFWFDDVKLYKAEVSGLEEDESLEARTVRRIDFGNCVSYTDTRIKDMSEFYIKLQDDYYSEMSSYLKDSLNVKVPIVGTNWNVGVGDLITQSKLDYVDNHSYWDHPSFPGTPWDSYDWLITNTPMVQSLDGGTIPGLFSGVPFLGKPFTISEYNHAFPNRYQSEALLFTTAYSSFHNADALMFFDYTGSATDWETDKVSGYFDIHRNSVMMALNLSCSFAFRNNLIAKANQTLLINYNPDTIYLLPKTDGGGWTTVQMYPKKLGLEYGIRNESFNAETTTDFSQLPPEPVNPYKTDTEEITLNTNGLLTVNTPEFIGVTGFLNNFLDEQTGSLKLKNATDFGSLTWLSLTNDSLTTSRTSLITLSSKIQNTGMIWNGTTTVNNDWGNAPTEVYPLTVQLELKLHADSIRVFPLNVSGVEDESDYITYLPISSNTFEILLDQNNDNTLWFGLELFGDGTVEVEKDDEVIRSFSVEQNYPNPFNPSTKIRWQSPVSGRQTLKIYDVLGNEVATLVDEYRPAGRYEVEFQSSVGGHHLASGIYFYTLEAGSFRQTRKMILLK